MSNSSIEKEYLFSESDRKKLVDQGFDTEKHPYCHEFAIKEGKDGEVLTVVINDDKTISAGYDSGYDIDFDETSVKVCKTVDEAIEFLMGFYS